MWFIVVSFLSFNLDGSQNIYVYNNPNFNSWEECAGSVTDPQEIPKYMETLYSEYRGSLPGEIEKVSCVPKEVYNIGYHLLQKKVSNVRIQLAKCLTQINIVYEKLNSVAIKSTIQNHQAPTIKMIDQR